jgi:hypothetical protein
MEKYTSMVKNVLVTALFLLNVIKINKQLIFLKGTKVPLKILLNSSKKQIRGIIRGSYPP